MFYLQPIDGVFDWRWKMNDEELTAVQEELMAAQSELEQLRSETADGEARAAHLEEQLTYARDELAQERHVTEARGEELEGLRERAESLQEQVRSSAQRYREVSLRAMPELPEELVAGETVEEVDASVERARETVSKVRGHLESQAQAGRVPVGAPPRSEPDLSALTAEEKIRIGLQQQSE